MWLTDKGVPGAVSSGPGTGQTQEVRQWLKVVPRPASRYTYATTKELADENARAEEARNLAERHAYERDRQPTWPSSSAASRSSSSASTRPSTTPGLRPGAPTRTPSTLSSTFTTNRTVAAPRRPGSRARPSTTS